MQRACRDGQFAAKFRLGVAAFLIAALTPAAVCAQDGASGSAVAEEGSRAQAPAVIGTCKLGKVKYSASPMDSGSQIITSTTFVKVFQAKIAFTQGGAGESCVIVQFSAIAQAAGSSAMNIRALLDGVTVAQPGEMPFGDKNGLLASAANLIFPSVAPGKHTIQMQFRSIFGDAVVMGRHSTIVQFVP